MPRKTSVRAIKRTIGFRSGLVIDAVFMRFSANQYQVESVGRPVIAVTRTSASPATWAAKCSTPKRIFSSFSTRPDQAFDVVARAMWGRAKDY